MIVVTIADVTVNIALTGSVEPIPAKFLRKYSSGFYLLGVNPDVNLLNFDVLNHSIQLQPES